MKGIFKFMTVALAAGMVASCSDDLGLESAKYSASKGDMTVSILAPQDLTTRMAVYDNGGVAKNGIGIDGKKFAWKTGEKVNVFSLNQTAQDIYECKAGGSTTSDFTQVVNANLTGAKFAVSESEMIYGISAATKDQFGEPLTDINGDEWNQPLPLLTLTIPSGRDAKTFAVKDAWKPGQATPGVEGGKNFPVPLWGPATVTGTPDASGVYEEGSTMTATVQGLTAYMRVNLGSLPEDTKYIVLTTHGGGVFQPEAGFILAPNTRVAKNATQAFLDARDTWYKAGSDDPQDEDEWITGGASEALSGTLNAVLDPTKAGRGVDKKYWPVLSPDVRLVPNDELIVDIQGLTQKIFYIPVVCNTYKNLHVIAATGISNKYRYCYAGTELKVFRDQEFEVNKMYYLDMSLVKLPKACIDDVNAAIKNNCGVAGMTTIIDVDTLYYGEHAQNGTQIQHTSGAWRPTASRLEWQINVDVPGNVVLNIAAIGKNSEDDLIGSQKKIDGLNKRPLVITDVPDNTRRNLAAEYASGNAVDDNGFRRTVEINVPSDWYLASQEPQYAFMQVVTVNRDVTLGTIDAVKANKVSIDVVGSNTKLDNTYTMSGTVSQGGKAAQNMKVIDPTVSAITIRDGFKNVNVLRKHEAGDVFVYTDYAEWETEIDSLDIQMNGTIGLRFDDALINSLQFTELPQGDRSVYTTGSAAIANVYSGKDKPFSTVRNNPNEDYINTNAPGNVTMYSYWTGQALSPRAINPEAAGYDRILEERPSYDQTNVFTVAQLASVGEGIYLPNNESNHETLTQDVLPLVNTYYIPKAFFGHMWLGASRYPWIGARARIDGFFLDGQNSELKNMNMFEKWNDNGVNKIDDPHWCCTSCWRPDSWGNDDLEIKKDFGLVRFVENSDEVTFQYINLNDIQLVPVEVEIPNVGGIVGRISTQKATLLHNRVGETKIAVAEDNIGGLAGLVELGWEAATEDISYQGKYVDGDATVEVVVEEVGNLEVIDNVVSGTKNESGFINGANYVGGLIGQATKAATASILENYVSLDNKNAKKYVVISYDGDAAETYDVTIEGSINASGDYAAGIVGYIDATDNIGANDNHVTLGQNVYAGGDFAAGIAGEAISDQTLQANGNEVTVKGNIQAVGDYAAGMVGHSYTKGDTEYIDNKVNVENNIRCDEFAGGLIGFYGIETYDPTGQIGQTDLLANFVRAKNIAASSRGAGGLVGYMFKEDGDVLIDDDQDNYNDDSSLKEDKEMVIVTEAISGNVNVGGLVGDCHINPANTLNVKAAQVKANTIKATAGSVGGFVGLLYTGELLLGVDDTEEGEFTKDYGKIVNVENMQGRLAVGGVVGISYNVDKSPVNIYTNRGALKGLSHHYKNYLNVAVKNWKKIGSNLAESEVKRWGTFGNIIGEMGDNFFVNNDKSITEDYDLLTVEEHLTSDVKDAVGYKKHNDNGHNVSDLNDPTLQYYWGDENGYVGYERNGTYKIATKLSKGEQVEVITPNDAPAHNVYKKLAIYNEGSKYAE